MIADITLDHIAVAVDSWESGWPTLLGNLNGKWRSGGMQPGFAPSQYAFENDMKIELIAPYMTDHNDFLKRFIEKSGTGPHHMTFKVKDITAAIKEIEAKDFRIVSKNIDNDWWKELFLYPKETCGIVIQLAQASGTWFVPPPENIPRINTSAKSELKYICYVVKDISVAKKTFIDLLGGQIVTEGSFPENNLKYLYIKWPGPGRILLLFSDDMDDQFINSSLNNKLGKVEYLYFEITQSGNISGVEFDEAKFKDLLFSHKIQTDIEDILSPSNLRLIKQSSSFNVNCVINYLS
jgi:methylmalonyl-CoA/ethylmalonyl-CoA epimerase